MSNLRMFRPLDKKWEQKENPQNIIFVHGNAVAGAKLPYAAEPTAYDKQPTAYAAQPTAYAAQPTVTFESIICHTPTKLRPKLGRLY